MKYIEMHGLCFDIVCWQHQDYMRASTLATLTHPKRYPDLSHARASCGFEQSDILSAHFSFQTEIQCGAVHAGIKKNAFTMFSAHQMGTSKMGIDPKTSVVDPKGQCWEVSRDSSLLLEPWAAAPVIFWSAYKLSGQSLCCEISSGSPCLAATQV